jgi:hypothetical protein
MPLRFALGRDISSREQLVKKKIKKMISLFDNIALRYGLPIKLDVDDSASRRMLAAPFSESVTANRLPGGQRNWHNPDRVKPDSPRH